MNATWCSEHSHLATGLKQQNGPPFIKMLNLPLVCFVQMFMYNHNYPLKKNKIIP